MTPRIPIYSDKGICNFCQATTRWGGAPHAPGCAYWQALTDITAHGPETVEQAAAMLATCRISLEISKSQFTDSFSREWNLVTRIQELSATRLAQRRKAAKQMKRYHAVWLERNSALWTLVREQKSGYLQCLRDTGILAPGETQQDLLKELEETGA